MRKLRIGLAQINCTVGDLDGNTAKIIYYTSEARALGVDLVCFPELALTGYPPEDLLLKPQFISDNQHHLHKVVRATEGITAVVGFVDAKDDIFNSAALIHNGQLAGVYHKMYLPNYGVFDEDRYFQAGDSCPVFVIRGVAVGINICEDIWYPMGPVSYQSHGEAEVIININASPFYAGKRQLREKMLATRAYDNSVILAYTNLVGGQDELVFDGASVIFDQTGEVITRGKQFEEDLVVADLDVEAVFRSRLHDPRRRKEKFLSQGLEAEVESQVISQAELLPPKPPLSSQEVRVYADVVAEVYAALVLGTKDYVHKNGFRKVVIGLSGGVDSSLTAVIAVDALGPENVIGVSMPSQYSSRGSRTDAQVLAKNLGIRLITVPIARTHATYLRILQDAFQGTQPDVTEENLQARIRGNILMALSNKFGWLVLATGNKSEMATGYSTLYGDMAGGFAVIKDVTKTLVYQLAHYRNYLSLHPIIPHSVIVKEPSAELRPNQRDVDTLPPYPVLDPILQAYVEDDRTFPEMIEMGFDEAVVKRVISMVDRSEYKRRQAPPGIKITPRAFGKDRRLPIVNRYRSF